GIPTGPEKRQGGKESGWVGNQKQRPAPSGIHQTGHESKTQWHVSRVSVVASHTFLSATFSFGNVVSGLASFPPGMPIQYGNRENRLPVVAIPAPPLGINWHQRRLGIVIKRPRNRQWESEVKVIGSVALPFLQSIQLWGNSQEGQ